MLEAFLKVAAEKYEERELLDAMTNHMAHLPNRELYAIATGQIKSAHLSACAEDSNDWLSKFEGTPLHTKALELAQREIDVEAARLEQRASRELAEEAQRKSWDNESRQRDSINLSKRVLDLELSRMMAESTGLGEDAVGGAAGVPPVASTGAAMPMDPASVAKMASACGVSPNQLVGMRKQALGLLSAAKGISNAAKAGWAGKGAARTVAAGVKPGGFSGALTNAGQYFGGVAKKNPGLAATMVAIPTAAAAGGLGYMAGK